MSEAGEIGPGRIGPGATLAALLLGLACLVALVLPPERQILGACLLPPLLGAALLVTRPSPPAWLALTGLGFLALHLRTSLAPGRSVEILAGLVLGAAALAAAAAIRRPRTRPVVIAVAAAGVLLAVLALAPPLEALVGAEEPAEVLDRTLGSRSFLDEGGPRATHLTPAALAGALALTVAALGALLEAGRGRAACLISLALVTAALLAIGSFAGLLAAGTVAALGLYRRGPKGVSRPRLVGAVTIVLACTVVAGVLAFSPDGRTEEEGAQGSPVASRAELWRGAVLGGAHQPLLGSGLGSFGVLYPSVRRPGDARATFAHGSWLQLAPETGIPGLVLILAGATWLVRRLRATTDPFARWMLAGAMGFALLGLFEPAAYLPGLLVPALALAGLAGPGSDPAREEGGRGWKRRSLPALMALAALAAGGVLVGEAVARHGSDSRGARWAPWSAAALARASLSALEGATPTDDSSATALLDRLDRLDPLSPAAARLRGDLARQEGREGDGWRAYAGAAQRSPADPEIAGRLERTERRLAAQGLLRGEFDYTARAPLRTRSPKDLWSTGLLLLHLALATALVVVGLRRGPALAIAPALLALMLLVPWGQGGRLSGAVLGRILVVAAAGLVALWSRRGANLGGERTLLDRPARLALTLVVSVVALSTWAAPDFAAARDGFMHLGIALALVVLSALCSRWREGWPRLLILCWGAAAGMSALVVLAQRAAAIPSQGAASAPGILLWGGGIRRAADFFHPGHLGTFLVGAGLALATAGILAVRPSWPRVAGGAALILVGLGQGARATLLALLAGVAVAAWFAGNRRARQVLGGLMIAGGLAGLAMVIARFSSGDPLAWTRLDIWRASAEAIASRPLLGFGPGGFASFAPGFLVATDDPELLTRFGRTFEGPHSDLVGIFLAFGMLGGLVVAGGVAVMLRSCVRATVGHGDRTWTIACLAGLASLLVHGLFDDLHGPRPAALVLAALLTGALLGRWRARSSEAAGETGGAFAPLTQAGRWAATALLATAVAAGGVTPWAADALWRRGEPERAATLDPAGSGYWIAAARFAQGNPRDRLARSYDRVAHVTGLLGGASQPWMELARVHESALRGPLGTRDTLDAAIEAWTRALELTPQAVLARRARGRLLAFRGDAEGAAADFERAVQDEPNFLGARFDLLRLFRQLGNAQEALIWEEELLDRESGLVGYHPENAYEEQLLTLTPDERGALALDR